MKKSSQLGRNWLEQAVLAIPPCVAAVANFSGTREIGAGERPRRNPVTTPAPGCTYGGSIGAGLVQVIQIEWIEERELRTVAN
jgi:hypothetical protein